jgi:Ca2+-binding RTX toxin-like protein
VLATILELQKQTLSMALVEMTPLMREGGTDILTGARGNDQFLFDTALPAAGVDTIIGFSSTTTSTTTKLS